MYTYIIKIQLKIIIGQILQRIHEHKLNNNTLQTDGSFRRFKISKNKVSQDFE